MTVLRVFVRAPPLSQGLALAQSSYLMKQNMLKLAYESYGAGLAPNSNPNHYFGPSPSLVPSPELDDRPSTNLNLSPSPDTHLCEEKRLPVQSLFGV